MRVEVLYFEGCPNHAPAVERVRSVLAEEGISATVIQIEVPDTKAAESLRFLGSPSIRINGLDLEGTGVVNAEAIGLSCRTYFCDSIREGVPPVELIRRAVRNAKGKRDETR